MPIDETTIDQARCQSTTSLTRVLCHYHPAVVRMARALTGRESSAGRVVRFVLRKSLPASSQWEHEGAPEQWFLHHTVMATRRFVNRDPHPAQDTLLGTKPTAEYQAFVRAIRSLPLQQREAFLLRQGEDLTDRQLAQAMDLSTSASANHLKMAAHDLKAIATDQFDQLSTQLKSAYQAGSPAPRAFDALIASRVARYVWPRRVWRWLKWLMMLATILCLGYLAWWLWERLVI